MTAALSVAILHFLWQGVVLAAVAAVLAFALRRRAPAVRYVADLGVLAGMAVVFGCTFVAALQTHAVTVALPRPAAPWLAAAWATGAGAMSARLGFAAWCVSQWRRRATPVTAAHRALVRRLAIRLGITAPVEVAQSPNVSSPVVVGWLRPMILLPLGLALRLPPAHLEAALAHELAHVRRHDYLVGIGQSLCDAVLFFHPAVWWLSRRIRRLREHCCDDVAAACVGDPVVYARALLALETQRSAPVIAAAATGGDLHERVARLVRRARATKPRRRFVVVASGWALAIVLGVLGSPGPDPDRGWLPPRVQALGPTFEEAGRRHGIDPGLLAVVTLVESGGNPSAQSPVGARGLMQLMPATAAAVARQRGISDHDIERLWDPTYNVDLGAYHLADLMRRFGSVELAAAAYNGGAPRVRAWLRGEAELSRETDSYRRKVTELYARL